MTDGPTNQKADTRHELPAALRLQGAPRLRAAFADAELQPTHRYPWPELEEYIRGNPTGCLRLVGYGSLINLRSAVRTLPVAGREAVPILAGGVQRAFNYKMPDEVLRRYPPTTAARERGVLNVCPTGNPADLINGVLLKIVADDLPAFRKREQGYDLVPVPCLSWHDLDEHPVLAYTLACPDEPRAGRIWTDPTLLPHRDYLRLCLDGALAVSPLFLGFFLESTYLADRRTRLTDWEGIGALLTYTSD